MARTPGQRARAKAYRQTDAGRLARKMHRNLPEPKMKRDIHRAVAKHLKGGF
jgi:hypothetical protein